MTSPPQAPCAHRQLFAVVKSAAITGSKARAVDIQLRCMECDAPFVMMGTPVGISTTNLRILAEPKT